ncbi:hypothetical protein [Phenylobacterium montanum]|uniref:Uncharacterized protein n=1 Tax=Phenylobacterium montanum TaxID=2823693 RepID=A0A975ITX2_9CAUL|nr:hypothetical protein [Caulobacter sp. S6]QUD86924.1 hypothetical protein KCG34_17865 [Caulobacter sp. S6]
MPQICLAIEDTRFDAPTVELATVRDRTAARKVAQERLQASPYHLAVKVREGDELVCWLRRLHTAANESLPVSA